MSAPPEVLVVAGREVTFDIDNGVPILMPMLGVCRSWPAVVDKESKLEAPFTPPGVGVNRPGGWFAKAAKAADVGSRKAEGVRDGVKRNGSPGALGVGSRSSWPANLG